MGSFSSLVFCFSLILGLIRLVVLLLFRIIFSFRGILGFYCSFFLGLRSLGIASVVFFEIQFRWFFVITVFSFLTCGTLLPTLFLSFFSSFFLFLIFFFVHGGQLFYAKVIFFVVSIIHVFAYSNNVFLTILVISK